MSKSVVADFGKRKKILLRYKMSKDELYLLEGHTKGYTDVPCRGFLSSFDLKSTYHHIDIHRER